MENNKIRVTTGIVIDVNDAGETITVNAEDQNFLDRFYSLIEKLEELSNKTEEKAKEKLSYRDYQVFLKEETMDLMISIDELFGYDACRKIFGENVVPGPFAIADFFSQLLPITEEYSNERQKRISEKYSRRRKGGR